MNDNSAHRTATGRMLPPLTALRTGLLLGIRHLCAQTLRCFPSWDLAVVYRTRTIADAHNLPLLYARLKNCILLSLLYMTSKQAHPHWSAICCPALQPPPILQVMAYWTFSHSLLLPPSPRLSSVCASAYLAAEPVALWLVPNYSLSRCRDNGDMPPAWHATLDAPRGVRCYAYFGKLTLALLHRPCILTGMPLRPAPFSPVPTYHQCS